MPPATSSSAGLLTSTASSFVTGDDPQGLLANHRLVAPDLGPHTLEREDSSGSGAGYTDWSLDHAWPAVTETSPNPGCPSRPPSARDKEEASLRTLRLRPLRGLRRKPRHRVTSQPCDPATSQPRYPLPRGRARRPHAHSKTQPAAAGLRGWGVTIGLLRGLRADPTRPREQCALVHRSSLVGMILFPPVGKIHFRIIRPGGLCGRRKSRIGVTRDFSGDPQL